MCFINFRMNGSKIVKDKKLKVKNKNFKRKKEIKMMNKKLVGTALVGLMTVGFAGSVLAEQTDNEITGLSNVNGSNSGKMEVRGNLGVIDNTDPEAPIDPEDDKWINVTFPTAVVFGTDDAETITSSSNYQMRNNSGRGVKVDVADYVISGGNGVPALTELNIKNNQNEVKLAENGATAITEKQSFAVLNTDEAVKFGFTGLMDETKLTGEKDYIESHIVFQFKAMAK